MNRQKIPRKNPLFSARLRGSLALLLLLAAILFSPLRVDAYVLTPQSWNTVGLDSNDVNAGPNIFPVGQKFAAASMARL